MTDKKHIKIKNIPDSSQARKKSSSKSKAKSKSKSKRLAIWKFLLILSAVLGIVSLAAWRDGTGFDAVRRLISYGTAEKNSGSVCYDYDSSPYNRFVTLQDRLIVLSDVALSILDKTGETIWSTPVKMSAPALTFGGGLAAAYDVGGTELHVLDENGEHFSMNYAEDQPIIAVSLNNSGWMAVTSGKQNYKGGVSVYNDLGELVFEFNSSTRFLTDACVTEDNGRLAAVTLGQENGVFVSNIILYDLHSQSTEPVADYNISNGLVLAIGQQSGRLVTVSDTSLTFANPTGKQEAVYSFEGSYLREYDFHGSGFTALLLNRYQAGSLSRLVTVDSDGEEIASLDVRQEVLSLSAAGHYLAVLYIDKLVVYNPSLQVYASLSGIGYARKALMRPDGSALLATSESASLFLP